MVETLRRIGLALLLTSAACTADEAVGTRTQSAMTSNGLATNGLATNGIWQNGIWQNGIWQNGIWQNGIWQNGIWQNGIWQNGIWQNGIWQNGIWQNGIWQNGIWQNGVWQGNLAALDVLRTNPYAGKLLQYIYGCAMPSGATKTLDPNGANIVLEGAIGLAPQWDTDGGTCDESCQRWISACVLARTNAYGVHVTISMRAPDDAPQAIKDALATTVDETTNFDQREGTYYGNIFATTPQCDGVTQTSPTCAGTATLMNTPSLYACAGPASNIPEITKRFCSSQGDNGPIQSVGTCLTPDNAASACTSITGPSNGVNDCYTNTSRTGTLYKEAITVYLKDPITTCGNAVCEAGEDTSCPSDCHPGSWAKTFVANFGVVGPVYFTFHSTSAIDRRDGSIVVAGEAPGQDIDLGGGVLPASGGDLVVAKLAADGTYVWGNRFAIHGAGTAVAVAPDGAITVAAFMGNPTLAIAHLSPDGAMLSGWPLTIGTTGGTASGKLAIDADGNIVVTSLYSGSLTFPTIPSTTFTATTDTSSSAPPPYYDEYVAKIAPGGQVQWAVSLGGNGQETATDLSFTPAGDVLIAFDTGGATSASAAHVAKLASATGAMTTLLSSPLPDWLTPGLSWATFEGLATDALGEMYVTGEFRTSFDFGPGCGVQTSSGRDFYLAKYSADGTQCRWVAHRGTTCLGDATTCDGQVFGGAIAFDREGNVVVGGEVNVSGVPPALLSLPGGSALRGGVIDLGAGAWDSYKYGDAFVASYGSVDGHFEWAKELPMVLEGNLRGLAIDGQDHIVVSGTYTGSMEVDDHLLVDTLPQEMTNQATNLYVASFPVPVDDGVPPAITNVPDPIVIEATTTAGATGWYTPPTSTDSSDAGTNVTCVPRPWATFPIGTTAVTCTATDVFGHTTTTMFPITVRDTIGPMISNVPAGGLVVTATTAAGAVATYPLPTAVDQVDGARPVTCTPSSGSTFPVGTSTVTCSASDASGNTSTTSFQVNVSLPYSWSGFLQPINADGSSVFKLGRTVPVKFALTGWSAGITNLVANLSVAQVSGSVTGTYVEASSTAASDSGNTFRYDPTSGQYVFNMSTNNLSTGTWRLSIDMHDGVVRTILISLH